MKGPTRTILKGGLMGAALLCAPAYALDLTGVWASDANACSRMFMTKGASTTFRKDSDSFGNGFIINGSRIRGKMATCNIRSTRNEGSTVHLIASCSDDVALSTMQFSVKSLDDNSLTRFYPGVPELETRYYRCLAK